MPRFSRGGGGGGVIHGCYFVVILYTFSFNFGVGRHFNSSLPPSRYLSKVPRFPELGHFYPHFWESFLSNTHNKVRHIRTKTRKVFRFKKVKRTYKKAHKMLKKNQSAKTFLFMRNSPNSIRDLLLLLLFIGLSNNSWVVLFIF